MKAGLLAGGGGLVLVTFTDNFNRANSNSLGGDWIETNTEYVIDTNLLSMSDVSSRLAICQTAMTYEDQYAEVDVVVQHASGTCALVLCKTANTATVASTYYYAGNNGANTYLITRMDAGVATVLAFTTGAQLDGKNLRFEVLDGDLKLFVDAVEVLAAHDPAPLTGLYTGILTDRSAQYDNFEAGDINDGHGSGGNAIASGGTLRIDSPTLVEHVFTSSGSFVLASGSLDVQYLVVGGGGAGSAGTFGVRYGGGGAAGTVDTGTTTVTTTQTVTIGTGGVGVSTNATNGQAGGSSVFGAVTSTGGNGGSADSTTGATNADYSGGSGLSAFSGAGGAGAGANASVYTGGAECG